MGNQARIDRYRFRRTSSSGEHEVVFVRTVDGTEVQVATSPKGQSIQVHVQGTQQVWVNGVKVPR